MTREGKQQGQLVAEQADVTPDIPAAPTVSSQRELSPSVELLLKALRITGSTQRLAEWIQTPIPALYGETPYSLMQPEEGRQQVDAVLSRFEHGVY